MTNIKLTSRENYLLGLLNKVVKEYKSLVEYIRKGKTFKIVEIITLSKVPGETIFAVQIANKNTVLHLSAAEIIRNQYDLNEFNDFHAQMIREAAAGKLVEFLSPAKEVENRFKVASKRYDRGINQYVFIIEADNQTIARTAEEIAGDKELLSRLHIEDIYDVGYTQGSESILREKLAILISKQCPQ